MIKKYSQLQKAASWVFNPEQEDYYMSEACPYLALAFNELYGYPLRLLIDAENMEEWGGKEYPVVAHVFVENKGSFLDIKGSRTGEEILKDFYDLEQPLIIEVSRKDLINNWMGDNKPLYPYSSEEVNIAKTLASSIKGTLK